MDPQSQQFAQSLVVCEVSCMYLDTNIVTVKKATATPLCDALLSTPATSSSSQASPGKYGSLASVVDPRGLYYRLGAVVNKTPRDGVIAAPRKVVPYDVVTVGGEAQGQKKTYGGTKSPYSSSKSGGRKHFVILPVDFEGKSNCSVAKKPVVAFPPPSDATSAEVFLNVSTNIDAFRLNDYVIRQKQLCQVKTIDRKEDPFSLELLVLPDKHTTSSTMSENVSSTAPSDPTSGVRHVNCELYHVAKIPHHDGENLKRKFAEGIVRNENLSYEPKLLPIQENTKYNLAGTTSSSSRNYNPHNAFTSSSHQRGVTMPGDQNFHFGRTNFSSGHGGSYRSQNGGALGPASQQQYNGSFNHSGRAGAGSSNYVRGYNTMYGGQQQNRSFGGVSFGRGNGSYDNGFNRSSSRLNVGPSDRPSYLAGRNSSQGEVGNGASGQHLRSGGSQLANPLDRLRGHSKQQESSSYFAIRSYGGPGSGYTKNSLGGAGKDRPSGNQHLLQPQPYHYQKAAHNQPSGQQLAPDPQFTQKSSSSSNFYPQDKTNPNAQYQPPPRRFYSENNDPDYQNRDQNTTYNSDEDKENKSQIKHLLQEKAMEGLLQAKTLTTKAAGVGVENLIYGAEQVKQAVTVGAPLVKSAVKSGSEQTAMVLGELVKAGTDFVANQFAEQEKVKNSPDVFSELSDKSHFPPLTAFHSLEGSPCASDRNRRDSFLSAYESLGGLESNGDRGSKYARSSQASKKISLVPGNLLGPTAASADAARMQSSSSSSSSGQNIDLPTAETTLAADKDPNDELMDVDTDAAKEKQEGESNAERTQIPSTAFPPPGPTAAHPLVSPPDAGERDKTTQVEDVFDIPGTPLEDAPMVRFEERQVLQKAAQGVLSSTEEAGAGVAETGSIVAGASVAAAELADAANNSEGVVRQKVHKKNTTALEEQVGPTAKPALQQDQLVILEPAPGATVKDVSLVHPPVVSSGGKEETKEEKIVGDVEMQVADVEVEEDRPVGEDVQEAEDDPDAMDVEDFSQEKQAPSQESAKERKVGSKGINDQVENKVAAAHQLLPASSGTAVDAPLLQPPAAVQPEQSIPTLEKNNKRDAMEQCGAKMEGAKNLKRAKTGAGGTTVSMKKSGTTKSSASSKKATVTEEEPAQGDLDYTSGISLDQQDNIEPDQGPTKPAPKMKVAPAMKKATSSAGGGKSKTGTKGAVKVEDFEQELIEENKEPQGATTAMKSSSSKAMKQTAETPAANNKSSGASSSTTSMKQEGAGKAMKASAAAMKQQPAAKSSGAKKENGGSSSSANGAQSSSSSIVAAMKKTATTAAASSSSSTAAKMNTKAAAGSKPSDSKKSSAKKTGTQPSAKKSAMKAAPAPAKAAMKSAKSTTTAATPKVAKAKPKAKVAAAKAKAGAKGGKGNTAGTGGKAAAMKTAMKGKAAAQPMKKTPVMKSLGKKKK